MAKLVTFIKRFIVALLLLALIVPTVAYIILSTPWAKDRIREAAVTELSKALGSQVEIGDVDYRPFNTVSISSVTVRDSLGNKVAGIGKVSARFEAMYFLRTRRLLFDYAVVDAPEINIWRDSIGAPLNIQPILDRFKKNDNKAPTSFDLKIGTIIIRNGLVKYNVLAEPTTPGRFNPNHIKLEDFNLHAYLRHAANDDFDAMIESMSFTEQSGFELSDLIVDAVIGQNGTDLRELEIELPNSKIALAPIRLGAKGFNQIVDSAKTEGINIATVSTATIQSSDLAAFAPLLGKLNIRTDADFNIKLSSSDIRVDQLRLSTADGIILDMNGHVAELSSPENRHIQLSLAELAVPGDAGARILREFNANAATYIERCHILSLHGNAELQHDAASANITGNMGSEGSLTAEVQINGLDKQKPSELDANVSLEHINLGAILATHELGSVTATIDGHAEFNKKLTQASGTAKITSADWNGHRFRGIDLEGEYTPQWAELAVNSIDKDARFSLDATATLGELKSLEAAISIERLSLEQLGLPSWRNDFECAANIETSVSGTSVNDLAGFIRISDIVLSDSIGSLDINLLAAKLIRDNANNDRLVVDSDFINGVVEGEINPLGLPLIFKNMAAHIVPALIQPTEDIHQDLAQRNLHNRFTANFTLENLVPLCEYLKLPVTLIYDIDVLAEVNSPEGTALVNIDAPYIKQGDKIIDSTAASVFVDTATDRMSVYATTHMPTKKGPMSLVLGVKGAENRFDTKLDWEIERAIPINGRIDLSTLLGKTDSGIAVDVNFNPGQINFGEDVWTMNPSSISWRDNSIVVRNFNLSAQNQKIQIDGVGSDSPDDIINISLGDINLISIFETLEIDNAMIGGRANGSLAARQILSKTPILTTDKLHVDSISYNHCVIGTADVSANWDNEKQSFYLDADIINPEGKLSEIKGDIYPAAEMLDLTFDANHVRVGFMQKFMEAFTSEVSGYGSGHARLFGTFKNIDMEGDIFAEDLKVKIDFTNTVYSATDSVHIIPGIIKLNDIVLHDSKGNTAKLNGVLTHEAFHLPRFNFQITDARDFLCYNITEAMNPDWYGTIYGNGEASIVGWPGVINISANMSTAPGSVFTFVLSDRLDAEQYSFITFNDATELTIEEKLAEDELPPEVKEYIDRINEANVDTPSDYNLDFRVDVNPQAQMILVMDPVGGDRINAYGNGDMRLTYNSTSNDLHMYGTYTLDRGDYNFTLQDIIIKEFTIEPGSSITFPGDPYSAQLNIEAVYQTNANLTDLDESFAQDKDLNRTNVPVQALLKITGDMRQPDLDFDLRFPTLTSDIYRKFRSIVSTDEMMNQQIIYLLALNRFYTPEYMDATRGNELFSVASSTIASQLSNMLGKLSDNWSIAPNLRSDRGDFSDVEVDVALSTRLLKNRLLINGNLGYRDKALNNNQFIGDLDIEYLLTPKGNWRLKGYSHYNDQNYYVRTAPTTQGLGIMFRRDFDSLIPRRSAPADTITNDTDSVAN